MKKTKENTYYYEINLKFNQITSATSETKALKEVKQSFIDEFNIKLEDNEIILKLVDLNVD